LREVLNRAVAQGYPADKARGLLCSAAGEADDEPEAAPTGTKKTAAAPEPAPLMPTDADCVRFAALFAGREDVYARQWHRAKDGQTGYTPVHEPLTPAVVRNHLLGTFTAGVYPIRLDQTATWFAVDMDIRRPVLDQARRDAAYARELRDLTRRKGLELLAAMNELGFEPMLENSGYKGRHYWVFLEEPEEAKVLNQCGRLLLAHLQQHVEQEFSLEFFPKQAQRTGKGLGNLIKLPLGVHRRTGYRSVFLDREGNAVKEPLALLQTVRRLPRNALYDAIGRLKRLVGTVPKPETALQTDEDAEDRFGESAHRRTTLRVVNLPDNRLGESSDKYDGAAMPATAVAGPAPPDVAPPWTEADFEADPRMRHLLSECPVLAELKSQVAKHRRLSHDEQVVLSHTLGHVPGGPQAVNYLLQQCVDVPADALMQSQLKGNPISCPKIRKRIGHLTRRVKCRCAFPFAPNHYPTPVLHLETLRVEPAPATVQAAADRTDPQMLARRYGVLDRQRREIERQWRQLHDALCQMLHGRPDRSLQCDDGRYELVIEDGVETLVWHSEEPTDASSPRTESGRQEPSEAAENT
ncbi:MAG: CRISPR-associated primase-polymerase type A1, partial [Thermoguttaceae bacterium]|nr:CRISPR-associated primase-polymerase type A1 [Thermoguttaceae bacterium]